MTAVESDVGKYLKLTKNDPDAGTVAGDLVMCVGHWKDPGGSSKDNTRLRIFDSQKAITAAAAALKVAEGTSFDETIAPFSKFDLSLKK